MATILPLHRHHQGVSSEETGGLGWQFTWFRRLKRHWKVNQQAWVGHAMDENDAGSQL
jgi:hypothetical protein